MKKEWKAIKTLTADVKGWVPENESFEETLCLVGFSSDEKVLKEMLSEGPATKAEAKRAALGERIKPCRIRLTIEVME